MRFFNFTKYMITNLVILVVRAGFEPATFATFIASRVQMIMDRGAFRM
jgi:hypothetical protein